RRVDEPVFNRREVILFLVITPLVVTIMLVTLFASQLHMGVSVLEARTTLLTAMIMTELTLAHSCRSLSYSAFRVGLLKNRYLILAIIVSMLLQILVLYLEPLRIAFGVVTPKATDWMLSILVALTIFAILEALKVQMQAPLST
ncbi:MAG TPA: hypothetical protein ENK81_02130, partial [Euryarchaeota archaeon]|nr:hypothetical protein [Euryarchaeota archaeon]